MIRQNSIVLLAIALPYFMNGQVTTLPGGITIPVAPCCATRNVLAGPSAGTWSLVASDSPSCGGGCLYAPQDNPADQKCFGYTGGSGSLSTCATTTPSPSTPTKTTTTTTTTATTTTTTTTTTATTTRNLRVELEEIWNMAKYNFTPDTIAETGDWGPDEFCPVGSYANSYQLYIAPLCPSRCNFDDDAALMGVRLFCMDYLDPDMALTQISSLVMDPCGPRRRGLTCSWMSVQTCPSASTFFYSSRYLSEYFHDHTEEEDGATFVNECDPGIICRNSTFDSSDPMGGLNLDMKCTDGTLLEGDGIDASEVPLVAGLSTTEWSDFNDCPAGMAICGIRSKVHQGETDFTSNLGQTQILFHCCELPVDFDGAFSGRRRRRTV